MVARTVSPLLGEGGVSQCPDGHGFEIASYNAIFRETQTVQIFAPSTEHPGPTIRIMKIVRAE